MGGLPCWKRPFLLSGRFSYQETSVGKCPPRCTQEQPFLISHIHNRGCSLSTTSKKHLICFELSFRTRRVISSMSCFCIVFVAFHASLQAPHIGLYHHSLGSPYADFHLEAPTYCTYRLLGFLGDLSCMPP